MRRARFGASKKRPVGVLPALTEPGVIEGVGLWRRAVLRPSDQKGDLFGSLAFALLRPEALPELAADGTSPTKLAKLLREAAKSPFGTIKGGLSQAAAAEQARTGAKTQPETRLALVIDQLEELFNGDIVPEERIRFFDAISALAQNDKKVWVIATLRSDFYWRCGEISDLMHLKEGNGQYDLRPPSGPDFAQIIRQPAVAAGLTFETDAKTDARLDDVLLKAADNLDSLPLLEFTLDELYKRRREDGTLTFAAYRELGGVEGALATRAGEVFSSLPEMVQASFPTVFRELVSLATVGDVPTRKSASFDRLRSTPGKAALVDAFIRARLFTADRSGPTGPPVVRIAHEALLSRWNKLADWIKENRELLQIRARIAVASATWEDGNRTRGFLLAIGGPLEEARRLRAENFDLSTEETALIDASEQQARRVKLLKRTAVVALVVLAVLAVIGGGVAEYQRRVANAARIDADLKSTRLSEQTLKALEAEREAKEQARLVAVANTGLEKAVARSMLRPLGQVGVNEKPTAAEIDALWELARSNERVRRNFFQQALADATTVHQLRNRSDLAVYAGVGLDSSLRSSLEHLIESFATSDGRDLNLRLDCLRIGVAMDGESPTFAEKILGIALDALRTTNDSRSLETIGEILKPLLANLKSTNSAQTVVLILEAIARRGNDDGLSAVVKSLASQLDSQRTREAVRLALKAFENGEHSNDTSNSFFVSVCRIIEVLARHLEPNDRPVTANDIRPLVGHINTAATLWPAAVDMASAAEALAQHLPPSEVEPAMKLVLDAMTDARNSLTADEAKRVVKVLAANMSADRVRAISQIALDEMSNTKNDFALQSLATAIAAMCERLPPTISAQQAEAATQRILAAISNSSDVNAPPNALRALAPHIEPSVARNAVKKILSASVHWNVSRLVQAVVSLTKSMPATERQAYAASAIDFVFAEIDVDSQVSPLAQELTQNKAGAVVDHVLAAMGAKETDSSGLTRNLDRLTHILSTLAPRLSSRDAATAFRVVLKSLVDSHTTEELSLLSPPLSALAERLDDAAAASVHPVASDALQSTHYVDSTMKLASVVAILQKKPTLVKTESSDVLPLVRSIEGKVKSTSDPLSVSFLTRALVRLSPKLPSTEMIDDVNAWAPILIQEVERPTNALYLNPIAAGLDEIGPWLESQLVARAARACAGAMPTEDYSTQKALFQAFSTLEARLNLSRKDHQQIVITAIRNGAWIRPAIVMQLLDQLDRDQASKVVMLVLDRARTTNLGQYDLHQGAIVEALILKMKAKRISQKEYYALDEDRAGPLGAQPTLLEHADQRPQTWEQFPSRFTSQQLVDFLKMPTCLRPARRVILKQLERQCNGHFESIAEFLDWARVAGRDFDLMSPPMRP